MFQSLTFARICVVPLVAVIDRLLSLRPEDRFSSAAEVAEELEMLLPVADRRKRVTRASPGSQQLRTSTASALCPNPRRA